MFTEIIENAITKENLEEKQKLQRKLKNLENIFREIGIKWEEQNNSNAVYYIYKNPQNHSISLQIGDIRFKESFCTIIQSIIKDNKLYVYVSPEDLIEDIAEEAQEESSLATSLKNITNTIQSPIKDVINAVIRSTEKSREEEAAQKKSQDETKEDRVSITKKDDEKQLETSSPPLFAKNKMIITENTVFEDLEWLVASNKNIQQIEKIVHFLLQEKDTVISEAMSGIDRGYIPIKNETAIKMFKNMDKNVIEVSGFKKHRFNEVFYNIGNVMFCVTSSESGVAKFVSKKANTYSKNVFR